MLLSSLFVYNQMGGIDESALDRLSLVTEMTKHIRVRAGAGETGTSAVKNCLFQSASHKISNRQVSKWSNFLGKSAQCRFSPSNVFKQSVYSQEDHKTSPSSCNFPQFCWKRLNKFPEFVATNLHQSSLITFAVTVLFKSPCWVAQSSGMRIC